MFEGCRLEIQNSCGRITALQIKQLFDNAQISECVIFPHYRYAYDDHSIIHHESNLAALITLTPVLEADSLEIWEHQTMQSSYYRKNSDYPLINVFVEWLHHKEAFINARRHFVFKREGLRCGHRWEPIGEKFNAFLDLVVQRFQSAELPCNFMVTWSYSSYVKPTDLFNENTKERLSIFQRENEPNIFRLWRRPSTLDDFHKLLPSAANKTIHRNIWEDPFYYHKSTETLYKTADIPTLPLGCSTKRRQQRFKILCKSRRTADSNDN
ncbi:hypothetical protein Ddc_11630 [Ditylenchus destructor]|nr:hypothetical protein Ddc_11630 [Ditylenchus destructor]